MLELWTDGSCLDNKNGRACGWAWLVAKGDKVLGKGHGSSFEGTNNIAELMAVITGLEAITSKGIKPEKYNSELTIFSDSQYVIKGITEWIHKWRIRGWVTFSGEPIKNRDLWVRLDAVEKKTSSLGWHINFRHVKGHSGIEFNEAVDKMAGKAAGIYRSALK